MPASPFFSTVLLALLTWLCAPASAQPAQPDANARTEAAAPFWAGAAPLWFGFHPPGHELTVEEVKAGLQRWLAQGGNPRLKVGDVTEKDSRTIMAEVVTVDNSLVQKFDIDRRTGMVWQLRGSGQGGWHHWGPAHRPWWGWSSGRESWRGWMPFPFIGMFVFMAFVLTVAILLLVFFWWRRGTTAPRGSALEALNHSYALGNINRTEYLRRKQSRTK